MTTVPPEHGRALTWLHAPRLYLAVTTTGNLVWETAHVRLYTLWRDGSWSEIAFAVLHCASPCR